MASIRRLLFPTDFSIHADFAWSYALTFARQFGAELHLLHVVTPPPHLTETQAIDFDSEQVVVALTKDAQSALDRLAAAADTHGISVRREVRVGVDFREIIDYAHTQAVDLIVMATHGRTGLAHALVGSVAEKVVRKASCPVLTIKPAGMKFEMS